MSRRTEKALCILEHMILKSKNHGSGTELQYRNYMIQNCREEIWYRTIVQNYYGTELLRRNMVQNNGTDLLWYRTVEKKYGTEQRYRITMIQNYGKSFTHVVL